ncbi:urease accessory protein UreF [Dictyobacter arantiisoli]|uniref:Urease accessory protein UreF n=1 Tax=Dictyobacter arantiisoli TaxID=2014874 RepID=A0A5A5TFM4_9CHLR|nr:urease accessory UreF family protein [Dictyobacter arantiisoli]GCF09946.1 urease accessory protein UreF [Dictyobacter arantiisoli]
MEIATLPFLRLLQLADSALPIGSAAHSYGLESMTVEEHLTVAQLEDFLRIYLAENGVLESTFCRLGYRLAELTDSTQYMEQWVQLNTRLSAYKTARESRTASATLGRRLLQLVASLEDAAQLYQALASAKREHTDNHYSIAFGLVGAILRVDEDVVVLAYLQQSLTGLISACQRLLPLGQNQASGMLWHLKSSLIEIAEQSERASEHPDELMLFTPLLDIGSMSHPLLDTRLFIS